jgi:hypothetical protein
VTRDEDLVVLLQYSMPVQASTRSRLGQPCCGGSGLRVIGAPTRVLILQPVAFVVVVVDIPAAPLLFGTSKTSRWLVLQPRLLCGRNERESRPRSDGWILVARMASSRSFRPSVPPARDVLYTMLMRIL